jgi:hypothetical protein
LNFATLTCALSRDRRHIPFPLLTDNLNLADVGNINPFSAGDLLHQRLQIPLHRLADNRFSETASLPGDVSYSLGVVHFSIPLEY